MSSKRSRTVVKLSNRSGAEVDVRLQRWKGELHITLLGARPKGAKARPGRKP